MKERKEKGMSFLDVLPGGSKLLEVM